MDALIDFHTEEAIFKSGHPTNLNDCYKRYCLMMGFSATSFASKRRFEMPKLINGGRNTRGMSHERRISKIFFDRFGQRGNNIEVRSR
jgi:hypothetical protein